jgi:hypothetical protein
MEDWNDDEIQYQRGEVSASMTDAVKDHSVEVRHEVEGATIVGDADLVGRLNTVCNKYSNIFSNTVLKEPAILPPMEREVDEEKWRKPINQTAPRKQSQSKKDEILTQIQVMILLGVIISSQAEYYSQVHLTPKPDNKWRFCIDYRWLNLSCKGMGWPLPHIGDMLQRLGEKKPKYYAKIDLTNGYHQAPLKKSSQSFTAFIAFCGLYEWTRVPMGLKGAPSYFQRVLANIVLAGILYHICEVYIDDIIIHGRTKDEFVNNVERVFERLQKHNITVKPSKCFFGHEEVEFVGHTINEKGMTFSREKIEKVLAIKEPVYGKELKSFLGVAGYFHAHIRDYANISRPLHKMLVAYERNRKLVWTEEGRTAFHLLKQAINECPTLFFVNEDSPIFLHTDASDYGIGGYLFQVIF